MDEDVFYQSFSAEALFGLPAQPESVEILNYVSSEMSIPVKTDAFTIVFSRDVRRNAYVAAELAMKVATSDKKIDVWYVNTYAGVNFLKAAFQKLFSEAGLKVRSRSLKREEEAEEKLHKRSKKVRYFDRPKEEWLGRWEVSEHDGRSYRMLTDEERAQEEAILAAEKIEEEELDSLPFKGSKLDRKLAVPNLRIYHVPIGTWDTDIFASDLEARGRMGCKQVVIINSFEYAPLTHGRKDRMARELLQLCDRLQLSIVIFSHEMKKDLEPGLPGRGPIGILAAKAAAVSRFADPFDKFYGSRKKLVTPISEPTPSVHEKQIYFSPLEQGMEVAIS